MLLAGLVERIGGPSSRSFFHMSSNDDMSISHLKAGTFHTRRPISSQVADILAAMATFSVGAWRIVSPCSTESNHTPMFPRNPHCVFTSRSRWLAQMNQRSRTALNLSGTGEEPWPAVFGAGTKAQDRFGEITFKLVLCFAMVKRFERYHTMRFDWVVRVRPDFAPLPSANVPHCLLHTEKVDIFLLRYARWGGVKDPPHSSDGRKCNPDRHYTVPLRTLEASASDHVVMVHRRAADAYFETFDDYAQCAGSYEKHFGYSIGWQYHCPQIWRTVHRGFRNFAIIPGLKMGVDYKYNINDNNTLGTSVSMRATSLRP